MPDDLGTRTAALLEAVRQRAATVDVRRQVEDIQRRFEGPLRVAIAGKVKAGKSTLLNALLGEELAPTDAGECTRVLTWYLHGHAPKVQVVPRTGEPRDLRYVRRDGQLDIDLGDLAPEQVRWLDVTWPTGRLRDLALLDTPGIASINQAISARTHEVLSAEDGRTPVVDAVVYLLRHVHASDARFLEAFYGIGDDAGTELADNTPLNTVGVLSRADEIGSCRLDALEVAARVARRYESDPRLRRLCPAVVPVNGLLAFAAATLRQSEFASLAQLAALPEDELGALLLSADRLSDRDCPVPGATRQALLSRYGLFGVRLGVHLLRTGVASDSPGLATELARRAGLDELRAVLLRQFQQRARVLKARSAIAAVEPLILGNSCNDADSLRWQLEELHANAHELVEMRLLAELRAGELDLRSPTSEELDRLLGGFGHDPATRLGVGDEPAAIRTAALDALASWRGRAQHPLASRQTQYAARIAIRTIEGIVADLPSGPPDRAGVD